MQHDFQLLLKVFKFMMPFCQVLSKSDQIFSLNENQKQPWLLTSNSANVILKLSCGTLFFYLRLADLATKWWGVFLPKHQNVYLWGHFVASFYMQRKMAFTNHWHRNRRAHKKGCFVFHIKPTHCFKQNI